jgi:hypothetical protein
MTTAGDHFTFVTRAGDLDCLGVPAGTDGFQQLSKSAVEMELEGHRVRVSGLDDLVRMKRAAGRPKDHIEADVLLAVREEIERAERRAGDLRARLDAAGSRAIGRTTAERRATGRTGSVRSGRPPTPPRSDR